MLNVSGTGKKILQQNIFTGNTLSLNDNILLLNNQVLELNSKQLTILSASANAILKSGNGFVESETNPQDGYGYLQWNVKNRTGNYVFPFGSTIANIYLPLTMDIRQAGTGSNGFIRSAIYPTDVTQNPNNRPFPVGVINMNNIAGQDVALKTTDRFWLVETGNYTIKPIADLQLSFLEKEWNSSNGSTNNITKVLLMPHIWNGTQWSLTTGSVQPNNNILIVTGFNFSNSALRATENSVALPVTLISFTAKLNTSGNAHIKWTTATEFNTGRFEIEKSINGSMFIYLKSIAAAGNSSPVRSYFEQDSRVAIGTSFYRLKMIDANGSFNYSGIVKVTKFAKGEILVFPNPATESISIAWEQPTTENITCNIYDQSGKVVLQWTIPPSINKTTKNIRTLTSGTYLLSWISNGSVNNRVFIKK